MKKTRIMWLFLILVNLFAVIPSHSAERMTIAVLDFKAEGINASLAKEVSDLVRDEFINSGRFIVLERSQIEKILQELEFEQTGCTDSSCAVEIGKMLSARKMMIGKVSRSLGKIKLNIRIVDVERGVAEFSARDKASTEELVEQAVERITRKLIARIEGKKVDDAEFKERRVVKLTDSERNRNGMRAMLFSVVPGLGQVVYGDDFALYEGIFFFVGTAALGYFSYTSNQDMKDKRDEYNSLAPNLPPTQYNDKKDDAEKAKDMHNIFRIAAISFYALNFVDAFFAGRRIDTKVVFSQSIMPVGEGFFAHLNPALNDDEDAFRIGYIYKF
ncbi:MAG: CsgG/HfaB family protein [Spirochaetota bacterium]|nr:CsgG/HfaB family protein [Spirochaetota bacterium]